MTPDLALQLMSDMLLAALLVGAPILGLSMLVGLAISILQVVTQIQEILPIEIDLRHLFEAPTVSKLAAVIDARRGDLGEQERALWAEILADYEQMSTGSL